MAAPTGIQFVRAFEREGVKELVKSGKLTVTELERDYNEGYVSKLLKDREFVSELRKLSRPHKLKRE
jgi:hypothetical protein